MFIVGHGHDSEVWLIPRVSAASYFVLLIPATKPADIMMEIT